MYFEVITWLLNKKEETNGTAVRHKNENLFLAIP